MLNDVAKQTIFPLSLFMQGDFDALTVCAAVGCVLLMVCAVLYVRFRREEKALHDRKAIVQQCRFMKRDTAELPDARDILYQCYEFEVEQDITYVHTEETLQ